MTAADRPIDPALHPIETGNYRIATPAIQAFSDAGQRCLRYRITGALIYGPSRIGKTRAIEYLRLLLAETHPKITTYHAQAEHKPRHAEGPFFANLLEAVGYPEPDSGTNPAKRMRLINKIKEACARNGSRTVILFCDEAQRYDENEYEWLRDVHDHLDRLQIRLFTFLVGQQELLAVKTALQRAKQDADRRAADGRGAGVLRHPQRARCRDLPATATTRRTIRDRATGVHAVLPAAGGGGRLPPRR